MARIVSLGIALVLLGSSSAAWANSAGAGSDSTVTMEPASLYDSDLLEGLTLLNSGKPAAALKIFDAIIAAYEKKYDRSFTYRCATANTAKDTLVEAQATRLKTNSGNLVLGSEEWCTALFGKGFAMIDLGKPDEAGPYLARAVEMDPLNAHFINEYAEWFKPQRRWQQSYDLFLRAWRTVDHDKQGPNRRVAARSLRGMAFNLIELGDLKEAERLYRQSLDYEPEAAAKVQGELDFIADVQAKRKAS